MVSPWTSPIVVQAHDDRVRAWCVTALDIQVSLRNLTAMLEDSMTSVKMLYKLVALGVLGVCGWLSLPHNFKGNNSMKTLLHTIFFAVLGIVKASTVKAPVFGTLNSAISNFQTWFVRTVMEVLF